jgi:outer membrane protein assembly factor BamB
MWPAVVILVLQVVALVTSVTPSVNLLERFQAMMFGPLSCILLFLLWLAFASRISWRERLVILGGLIVLAALVAFSMDPSMAVAMFIYGIPLAMVSITLALYIARDWNARPRVTLCLILLACVWSVLLLGRLDGFNGNYFPEFAWRWSATAEQKLKPLRAEVRSEDGAEVTTAVWNPTVAEWPGFRGAERNGRVEGVTYDLNWNASPPREVWRISLGPAWSSFAYVSGRLFTQEQRDQDEVISCYDADNGELIWGHAETVRFTEVVSGPGPRATPTYHEGRLYAYGAKGILCALDATSGELIWRHELMREVNARVPMWGFSSSPLVLEGVVIIHADGNGANGLIAFDVVDGESVWRVASQGMNFSSAQPVQLDGQSYAVFADAEGVLAVDPKDGKVAWKFTPSDWEGPAIVQMQQIDETSLIVPLGDGIGAARLNVVREGGMWKITEQWNSKHLKPTFNDFVYHDGYLYGFDRNIFTCVDARTGQRRWKRGRYGFGQVVLLADRAQLIVATEKGEVVLLEADPSNHAERGRVKAVRGKTWNHPIVADGNLFLRNGSETVCLSLIP